MILAEYRIGQLVITALAGADGQLPDQGISLTSALGYVLTGSMIVSCTMMILGYVAMHVAFILSDRSRERLRRRRERLGRRRQPGGEAGP